jgi:hypothetical protein
LAAQEAKGEKPEHHRNHGKTIGTRDPATGGRSAKIGVIAGQTRSPRAAANSNRGVGLERDIPGEKRYRNVTPARE